MNISSGGKAEDWTFNARCVRVTILCENEIFARILLYSKSKLNVMNNKNECLQYAGPKKADVIDAVRNVCITWSLCFLSQGSEKGEKKCFPMFQSGFRSFVWFLEM